MNNLTDEKRRAANAYNAASDTYDDPANTFWDHFGRRTIIRLNLTQGQSVLDVCCGSGASAIPAAEIVGPSGSVTGVDLAEKLLQLARAKAKARGLENIEFQTGDLLNLNFSNSQFDCVVCVFGVFFVADMPAAIRELWRVVQPGGKLAITTWGPRFFEPATTIFWNSIREVRPDLYKGFNPWDRICDPASLRKLLFQGGVEDAEIVAESGSHAIRDAKSWWAAVRGSGYRGTLDQLTHDEIEHVRTTNFKYIHESGVQSVEANVIYAVAIR